MYLHPRWDNSSTTSGSPTSSSNNTSSNNNSTPLTYQVGLAQHIFSQGELVGVSVSLDQIFYLRALPQRVMYTVHRDSWTSLHSLRLAPPLIYILLRNPPKSLAQIRPPLIHQVLLEDTRRNIRLMSVILGRNTSIGRRHSGALGCAGTNH